MLKQMVTCYETLKILGPQYAPDQRLVKGYLEKIGGVLEQASKQEFYAHGICKCLIFT